MEQELKYLTMVTENPQASRDCNPRGRQGVGQDRGYRKPDQDCGQADDRRRDGLYVPEVARSSRLGKSLVENDKLDLAETLLRETWKQTDASRRSRGCGGTEGRRGDAKLWTPFRTARWAWISGRDRRSVFERDRHSEVDYLERTDGRLREAALSIKEPSRSPMRLRTRMRYRLLAAATPKRRSRARVSPTKFRTSPPVAVPR